MSKEELIRLVMSSFEAERNGDVSGGLKLVADDFKVVDMSLGNRGEERLPSFSAAEAKKVIGEVYHIKGREYQFVHVVADEDKQLVMVEFVETYPDPETGQVYRTPQVAVCKIVDGKIARTRHYNDPRVSYAHISQEEIDEALS